MPPFETDPLQRPPAYFDKADMLAAATALVMNRESVSRLAAPRALVRSCLRLLIRR